MQTATEGSAPPAGSSDASPGGHNTHHSRGRRSGSDRSHRRRHREAPYSRRTILRVLARHAKVIAVELAVGAVITYLLVLYLNSANAPAFP